MGNTTGQSFSCLCLLHHIYYYDGGMLASVSSMLPLVSYCCSVITSRLHKLAGLFSGSRGYGDLSEPLRGRTRLSWGCFCSHQLLSCHGSPSSPSSRRGCCLTKRLVEDSRFPGFLAVRRRRGPLAPKTKLALLPNCLPFSR